MNSDKRRTSLLWLSVGLWGLGLPVLVFYAMDQRLDEIQETISDPLHRIVREVAADTATRVATDTATSIAQQIREDVAQTISVLAFDEVSAVAQELSLPQSPRSATGLLSPRSRWRTGYEFPEFDREAAPEIVVGMPQETSIPANGFSHMRLDVVRQTTYRIDAIGRPDTNSVFDPYLYLYSTNTDDSLDLVAANDDGGAEDAILAARLVERLEPGTYYIVVEGFAGDSGSCTVSVEPL